MEEGDVSCKTTHTVYSFTERDIVLNIINRVSVSCSDDIALESDLEKLTSMLLHCVHISNNCFCTSALQKVIHASDFSEYFTLVHTHFNAYFLGNYSYVPCCP